MSTGFFGKGDSMRDKIRDDGGVKGLEIDEHGFELGNDFSHEESVVEFIVVLFVDRVKNHGSYECAEAWLVCFGSYCGEGTNLAQLREWWWHVRGLEGCVELGEARHAQCENGCGLGRHLAKKALRKCLLADHC